MDAFFIVQIAAGVYLGAIAAAGTILGTMKYDAEQRAGKPGRISLLLPSIMALVFTLGVLIVSSA